MKTNSLLSLLLFTLVQISLFSQDKLVFNDQQIVECKVLEITPELIKYTKHSMPDGPVYSVYKREVNSIVFENGEIELIQPLAPATADKSGKEKRHDKAADWPEYRSSWGIDIFSPLFGELETWFEIRNENNNIGHTISLIGIWTRNGYYFDDYYCYDTYCSNYYSYNGGGFALGYSPKFYFIDHPIARPFAGPEVAMGVTSGYGANGYFHGLGRVGVVLTPKPKFNITIDVAGGGYLSFDRYAGYGGGLINLGISLGVNFGKGKPAAE
jgi:hypothetical protein